MGSFIDQDKRTATSDKRFFNETANDRWMGLSSTCRRIVCIRLDWGEIPGLFLLKKVATKLLIFVAT